MQIKLQEKSQADLKRLADLLKTKCEESIHEHEEKSKEDPTIESECT